MICLIGDAPRKSLVLNCPIKLLLRMTDWLYCASCRSSGSPKTLMLPETRETLYCPPRPPRPEVVGNLSFGIFGTRPELLTTREEFSTPVPLPLPINSRLLATATAEGYCPV